MLGACHIMACVLWYVGTYNLPPVWRESLDQSDSNPQSASDTADYQALLANHWLGSYAGDNMYMLH